MVEQRRHGVEYAHVEPVGNEQQHVTTIRYHPLNGSVITGRCFRWRTRRGRRQWRCRLETWKQNNSDVSDEIFDEFWRILTNLHFGKLFFNWKLEIVDKIFIFCYIFPPVGSKKSTFWTNFDQFAMNFELKTVKIWQYFEFSVNFFSCWVKKSETFWRNLTKISFLVNFFSF